MSLRCSEFLSSIILSSKRTEMLSVSSPDFIEIIPGVIGKVISRFASRGIPVIAGGLIESKAEITEALSSGASAVSTGKKELWYM